TKMSSKSAIKLLIPAGETGSSSEGLLFKFVAVLTGSKNALKGVGFFLGALLLSTIGFQLTLWGMAGALGLVLLFSLLLLKGDMGKSKNRVKITQLFSKSREINWLSAARFFLFGSRDVWFVVALPIFLHEVLGWNFWQTGTFMAVWVIGYGAVQAIAPKLVGGSKGARDERQGPVAAAIWGSLLALVTLSLAAAVQFEIQTTYVVLGGLAVFGVVFAVNSAVHSYLILAYSDSDKVALNVGFYYMANALGRLLGTLLSGIVYIQSGLAGCLWTSGVFVVAAVILTLFLLRHEKAPAAEPTGASI
ncbi:MAG: MFS transporter, partial [Verrucomicrobiota bacterium]